MEQYQYPKERLSLKNVYQDIRERRRKDLLGAALFFVITALCILLFILALQIELPYYILHFAFLGVIGAFAVFCFVKAIAQSSAALRRPCIVRDTLIGMYEEDIPDTRFHARTKVFYFLRFSSYGEYPIPDENYRWSEKYPLSAHGVYLYSAVGDTYYLLLSKPHNGKILRAYNSKLFEADDTVPYNING